MTMDINLLRNAVTIAALVAFIAILCWVFAPSRKSKFERDALVPFDREEP